MPNRKKEEGADLALRTPADSIYIGVVASVLQNGTNPSKNKLLGALRARQFKTLLDWSDIPSPQMYDSASSYFDDCQIAALIKKYPFTPKHIPGIDPKGTAVKKFRAAEHRCKRYNLRARLKRRRFNANAQIFEYARSYIEKTIGLKPDLTDILSRCDFTDGSNVGVNGDKTNAARKLYARRWTVTPSAIPYAVSALWMNIHARHCILPGAMKCYDPDVFRDLVKQRVDLVSCNKVTFVPKTAKTYRSIAVEPLLNGFVQKGVDLALREKLERIGIDLSDQRVNQLLARSGSTGGFNPYCTIDLSAASDSLSTDVVKDLLPPEWFEFLSDIRSPCYELDGHTYRYEKFCSMGNGFCFPLQTLIFASVCYGVERFVNGHATMDFAVYGDDIIVRQNVALVTIEMLRDIGFKVNTDKTFLTGPFRESCGSDWYDGQDVRPVCFDKPLTELREVFAFHNSTLRSSRCELVFNETRTYLRSLHRGDYLRPGREPGDTAFSVPLDVFMGSSRCSWNRDEQSFQWSEILSLPVEDQLFGLNRDELANARMFAAMRGAISSCLYAIRYTSVPIEVTVSRQYRDDYPWVPRDKDVIHHVSGARNVVRILQSKRMFRQSRFRTVLSR